MLSFTQRVSCNKKSVDKAGSRLDCIILREMDPETLPSVSSGTYYGKPSFLNHKSGCGEQM